MNNIQEHVIATIQRSMRLSAEVVACLIAYPDCMDGDSRKGKAYQMAIQYFTDKQELSKMPDYVSCTGRGAVELQILLECYDENEGDKKQEYAKKIANKLLETQEHYLMRIPDEIKDVAFQIAIKYLEEKRDA